MGFSSLRSRSALERAGSVECAVELLLGQGAEEWLLEAGEERAAAGAP